MANSDVEKADEHLRALNKALTLIDDSEIPDLVNRGGFTEFLGAILDPKSAKDHDNIAEYFLKNRNRNALIGILHFAITNNYAIQGANKDGQVGFVSPSYLQWFPEGVM